MGVPTPTPTPAPTSADRVLGWLDTTPGRVLLAVGVLVLGWYVSRLIVRYLGRPVARRFQRPSVSRTVLRGIRTAVLFATGFVALAVLGVGLPDIVLSVAVLSVVIGIILAPIASSVIDGLFVLADQPYEVGDMIEITDLGEGTRGYVEDITIRYTKVFTLDNTFLLIPNETMRERDVINFSAEDERIRTSLSILVTYESDVQRARRLIERAARNVDGVITGGPDIRIGSARYAAGPTCYVEEYDDDGVRLTLRYWVRRPYKLLPARSAVNEAIWEILAEEDVEFAYPHQHVVFDETSGQARVVLDDERGVAGRAGKPPGNPDGDGGDSGG